MILESLVKKHMPDVEEHCEKYNIDLKCVTAQWFLCLFINALPWEGVLRVWDLVFYYGNRAWLFSIALAVVETQRWEGRCLLCVCVRVFISRSFVHSFGPKCHPCGGRSDVYMWRCREKIVTIKDTGDTLQHLQNSVMQLFDISGLIDSAYTTYRHTSMESTNGYRARFRREESVLPSIFLSLVFFKKKKQI